MHCSRGQAEGWRAVEAGFLWQETRISVAIFRQGPAKVLFARIAAKKVGHGRGGGIAGVIQAGKPEPTFDTSQQRKVSIELAAAVSVRSVVDSLRDGVPQGEDGWREMITVLT